jgi:2'-5' RNA ligase
MTAADQPMNVDIWRNYFDVVILPPPLVRDHAIALSTELQRYGGKFVLGKRRFMPHISLYHIPVRPENFDAFSQTVKAVAARQTGGDLQLRSIDMPLLMTDKPPWLQKLHMSIVKQTSPYFDWDHGAEETWTNVRVPANLRVRANGYLQKFGSPLIGAAFRPHITLTSFEDKSVAKTVPAPDFERISFHVDEVSICELGPSHSCQRRRFSAPIAGESEY